MITKQDIIKMAKHVVRKSRRLPDHALMHPQRDWTIGLVVFVLLVLTGAAYAAYVFTRSSELDTNVVPEEIQTTELKRAILESTVRTYEERAKILDVVRVTTLVASTTTQSTLPATEDPATPDSTVAPSIAL